MRPAKKALNSAGFEHPVTLEEMREELIRAAAERRTLTYGYLMERFKMSRGSSSGETVVGSLAEIDRREHAAGAPGFAAIVVRKDTGYPGGGFFTWEGLPQGLRRPHSEGQNPVLTEAERRYVDGERDHIWAYYGRRYPSQQRLEPFTGEG
jgi:hypothetical protein